MIKIIHLLPALNTGGTERMVDNISKAQSQHAEVTIIYFYKNNEPINFDKKVHWIYCPDVFFQRRFFRKNLFNLDSYNSIIANIKPDYIHSHTFLTDIYMLNGLTNGAKLISHWHLERQILKFEKDSLKNIVVRLLDNVWYQNLLQKKDVKIISVSNYSAKYHKAKLSKKLRNNVFTLRNAIFTQNFNIASKEFKSNNIKLVCVGRLEKEKNQMFLLKVLSRLNQLKNYNFSLDIYGDGSLKEELNRQIKSKHLDKIVQLKGNVSNIHQLLPNYHINLHCSKKEQFGLSIIEAFNAKLPTIALDYEAVNELVIDKFTGYIIKKDDEQLYSKAILNLVQNPELYYQLSQNAYEYSLKFNFKEYMVKLNRIYSN